MNAYNKSEQGNIVMHTFEASGLGKAPFKYITPSKIEAANAGQTFFCNHCGTIIQNRHFIKSDDGKVSIVGVDCLEKTGDEGLVAGELRQRKELRNKARAEKQAKSWAETQEKERKIFNGLTRNELCDQIEAEVKQFKISIRTEIEESEVLDSLNSGNFADDMKESALKLQPYSPGQLSIIKKIYTKFVTGARANSKAYNEAKGAAFTVVDAFQERLISASEHLEKMNAKRIEVLTA